MSSESRSSVLTRRQLLAAGSASALTASSGCIQRLRSILNRDSGTTASLEILTVPSDNDELATKIANEIAENLESVGIDISVEYLPYVELHREVLINGNFEMFVGQMPVGPDPDSMRGLLHSLFAEERGWQNPYNYTDLTLNELLADQQRRSGSERVAAVGDVLDHVVREQPFVTIGHLQSIRAVNSDAFTGWDRFEDAQSPLTYVGLETTDGTRADSLKIAVTDTRVTRNFNPLSVEYRREGTFTGLVYDPLVYRDGSETLNWLAADVAWEQDDGSTVATVTLRPDLEWHDETPLTAEDVAFTYEFLQDTSLGENTVGVPTPRFRGRTNVVAGTEVVDDETVRFEFGETARQVAERAFTAPLLPEHIWREKSADVDVSGGDSSAGLTEALVWENTEEPVGSGPLRVEDIAPAEVVEMSRYENHFLHRDSSPPHQEWVGDGLAFDRFEIQTAPSDETAIEVLSGGSIDATSATVKPGVVPRIGQDSNLSLIVQGWRHPYHVGYNTEVYPFSNPHMRRLVARLVDKSYIAQTIFEGYGEAASNPFDGTAWNPDSLAFEEADPEVPFIGDGGDVEVDAARAAFRERGFAFDENGNLILR